MKTFIENIILEINDYRIIKISQSKQWIMDTKENEMF